jgi:hypothetical protein
MLNFAADRLVELSNQQRAGGWLAGTSRDLKNQLETGPTAVDHWGRASRTGLADEGALLLARGLINALPQPGDRTSKHAEIA